mmetsp:Transcript_20296/g.9409  ORF Transcript_20296/g.9409 Transcript_20296/m.9409 type:complete len:101 (-) Transcript_20296:29-331(-)
MFEMGSDSWSDHYRIEDYIMGLLWLIYEPNFEDPLNSDFSIDDEESNLLLIKEHIQAIRDQKEQVRKEEELKILASDTTEYLFAAVFAQIDLLSQQKSLL